MDWKCWPSRLKKVGGFGTKVNVIICCCADVLIESPVSSFISLSALWLSVVRAKTQRGKVSFLSTDQPTFNFSTAAEGNAVTFFRS